MDGYNIEFSVRTVANRAGLYSVGSCLQLRMADTWLAVMAGSAYRLSRQCLADDLAALRDYGWLEIGQQDVVCAFQMARLAVVQVSGNGLRQSIRLSPSHTPGAAGSLPLPSGCDGSARGS
jgi:hypothetical protein